MSEEQQVLSEQLEQAQRRLTQLEASLGAVRGELDALATRREQFACLEEACVALEKLAEQGVAELFWGGQLGSADAAVHLREVRGHVDGFLAELKLVEDRRVDAEKAVEDQLEVVEILDDDLFQAKQREERRKQEWLIEREADPLPQRRQIMPWMRGLEDDRLFRKHLAGSLAASILLGLLIPMIELPVVELDEPIEVPERLARLIRQEPEPVPPAQTVQREEPDEELPEPEPQPEPEPETPPQAEQPASDKPVPAESKPQPKPKGILAFRENLSNLAQNRPSARLGSQARISNAGDAATGRPERAMVTAQGEGSSGGINLAALSRDVGDGGVGQQISGVQATRVSSSIDAGTGGSDRPRSAGASAGRTDEEIQIVFDRYKAALYRLYNRELRRDPTLRGQIVLKLTIEPDGTVSLCRLQSSDMQAPDLVQQVVDRVSGFDFGAKDNVPSMTILYPIDFLPTA